MPRQKKTIEELREEYELELDRVISKVKDGNMNRILLQFPDGMKPYATSIVDYLKKKTNSSYFIWQGSCFGACDLPQVDNKDFDLIVQFGHSPWNYDEDSGIEVID